MKKVFFSYSHRDESFRDALEAQLSILKKRGVITAWHDRAIDAGEEIDRAIDENIHNSDVILLLISPDFIASDYCYDIEMTVAMERHGKGESTVIPVIIRPCDWKDAPFSKLMAVPTDGKPVTLWSDRDSAFLDITNSIKRVVQKKQ
ncbi:toll/interleukin-1 receptor domain-containing protein [Halomonas icarae]|uniref:TIR domain-containing protein n=1 Tax=Halomonas icarae TaxID=2691040 RepID=A0A7X4VYT3_9GAMM|nr:toll/interleukin-1 receptor domain-containing protein [Halomonas icarae]MDR5901785.1 toll/interleukin-1 receptor domain-containing protein [Halomonas icarae]NAW12716.1 TIR domain-containing protein [Halomonas icarae]